MSKSVAVRTARIPTLPGSKKTGVDDLGKLKGVNALKKVLKQAAATPVVSSSITLVVQKGSDADMERTEFLWAPYIPKAKLSGVKGDPGDGKTTLLLGIAAELSRGRLPSTGEKCEPVNTLYFSHENDPTTQVYPRFEAAGGDRSRLFVVTGAVGPDGKPQSFSLANVEALSEAIKKDKIGLVVFDPLQSYLGGKVDMHRANETRPLLDGLVVVTKHTGATIMIVRHLAKSSAGRSVNSGLGSIDIVGAVRSELLVGKSPHDPTHWVMIHDKSNVGKIGDSLRFAIESAVVKNKKGERIETAKATWRGKSDLTAADLRAPEESKQKSVVERACEWLRTTLADGPRLATELFAEWADESGQVAETAERTMQKATKELRVIKDKGGKGKHGAMVWKLPAPRKFEAESRRSYSDTHSPLAGRRLDGP
jgi:hypothetical protein